MAGYQKSKTAVIDCFFLYLKISKYVNSPA